MFNRTYVKQVELLLQVLPLLQKHDCFALKGGTAMNLFVQDMPRLSVDIDLAYLPLVPREDALAGISGALEQLAVEIEAGLPGTTVQGQPVAGVTGRLVVNAENAQIKVEPNFVFRGALFPPETRTLCASAQIEFERFVESRILCEADIYGGKICAALDRQHPRDLFDVHLMFRNPGLTDDIRSAASAGGPTSGITCASSSSACCCTARSAARTPPVSPGSRQTAATASSSGRCGRTSWSTRSHSRSCSDRSTTRPPSSWATPAGAPGATSSTTATTIPSGPGSSSA
ncbi:MAG: nucleotidyl transferase AbiEii/AbiGii toxin family protein, partial [Lentisphaerae bacterium]|nr:nucleotidyl transferase AbiEii/AbiGii toxin family protein [Lentisphaerota bacterium]